MGKQSGSLARGFLGREEKRLPGVRYVVIQTETPEHTAEFYQSVFELRKDWKSVRWLASSERWRPLVFGA